MFNTEFLPRDESSTCSQQMIRKNLHVICVIPTQISQVTVIGGDDKKEYKYNNKTTNKLTAIS